MAIELAAARVIALSPAELLRRLDRRFQLLAGGWRSAVERHATLRAAIDWSFELLDAAEQRLLARLSVFSGGCTLEAVEEVCSGDPVAREAVMDLVAGLVARSLVVAEESGQRHPVPHAGNDSPVRGGTARRLPETDTQRQPPRPALLR